VSFLVQFRVQKQETAMTFLYGKSLTAEMKRLVGKQGKIKIGVAYWGQDALTLLKLNPKKKNILVLCCLKGGKSDPDVIKQFKKRARQCDNLHAKVVWTKDEAIVGSANASASGMPSEDNLAAGLIEAGVLITDGKELRRIETWFDMHYSNPTISRPIEKPDLEAARKARVIKPTQHTGKKSLLDAIREGGKDEFQGERILFVMYKDFTTNAQDKVATGILRKDAMSNNSEFNIGSPAIATYPLTRFLSIVIARRGALK
jgi:hypothetical protein